MPYPIILAHGVCRFDEAWNRVFKADNSDDPRIDNLHYFKGVRTMLKARGLDVFHTHVPWAAPVDKRAEALKKNIGRILKKTGARKVNIIAHSMGGLDARHMLFNDRRIGRIHERIASLTTISTPHSGSPFADWGLQHLPRVIPLLQYLGLDLSGLRDLTTDTCRTFNARPDVKAFEKACESWIRFQTYAGRQKGPGLSASLRLSFRVIQKVEGDNDGLVSVRSAKWHERYFRGILEGCDHLNELGWWNPCQILAGESPARLLRRIHRFYATVAEDLP
ncbi:MAG: hypothetical protein JRI36_09020 [Deltaproteobacteria bacterium]|nr:hypothetical protein [Deltaproteobacteria bacterium]